MTSKAQQETGYGWARKELELRIGMINKQLEMNADRIAGVKKELSAAEDFRRDNLALREGYMQILKLTPDLRPEIA